MANRTQSSIDIPADPDAYRVQPASSGSTVAYSLSVDLNLRLPGTLERTAEKTIVDTALKGLKRQVAGVAS